MKVSLSKKIKIIFCLQVDDWIQIMSRLQYMDW